MSNKPVRHRAAPTNIAFSRDIGEVERGLNSARVMARAWIKTVPDRNRQHVAWTFVATAIARYVELASIARGISIPFAFPTLIGSRKLDRTAAELARAVGEEVAELPIADGAFQLSATYTALVPDGVRSELGMYYTPPPLTERLLDMAEDAGVDLRRARVLDPACGGGAFLLPVALRMRRLLGHLPPAEQLRNIAARLRGFEIDPFAAWLTQTWLDVALADLAEAAHSPVPQIVEVCDTLDQEPDAVLYDLVIGNPPYGRTTLSETHRSKFARSLYGHANLYGVFTDIALRWTQPGGTIAFVTPPSFLSGQYFKALRALIAAEASPLSLDFIAARKGVFEDVLQETILATYARGRIGGSVTVHHLEVAPNVPAVAEHVGQFSLPKDPALPWLAPRNKSQATLLASTSKMRSRLASWGYEVSTGPLVWNRFKPQLRDKQGANCFPIVWAEAITGSNSFTHRAEKRDHRPYFRAQVGDDWLKVTEPCVLVQRTTAKEQPRRLIAAEMPRSFIKTHGAAIVENHLNMVRAAGGTPKVSPAALAAFLNTEIVDVAFRCISGSVAVSAFELEALPVPAASQMQRLEGLVERGASVEEIEGEVRKLYGAAAR